MICGTFFSVLPAAESTTHVRASYTQFFRTKLISMNATFATGRQENLSMESRGETVLGSNRLELYKLVAAAGSKKSAKEESWPLWLPTPFRVFVSCNLCAEGVSGAEADGAAADQFIVSGFLNSLIDMLSNLDDLLQQDSDEEARMCLEEEIPLSLLDARLVVGACARLPDLEQVGFLDRFLDCVNMNLTDVSGNTELLEDRGVSSFLARVVTTASHVATLVGCPPEYKRNIQRSLCDSFSRRLTTWGSADKHAPHITFMGILSNWETTDLPSQILSNDALPGSLFPKLQQMIDTCFNLGFKSIAADNGHLLYAAWNAHGKNSLWNPVKDQLGISTISIDRPTSAVLTIRNDLCFVQRRIRSDQGVLAKTSISKSLDRNLGAGSPRNIVDNLKVLVEKGSENINRFLDSMRKGDGSPISAESCALLQSLCVCVSFGISMLSVTETSFFAELMNRQVQLHRPRGYSTDSERVDSDADSGCSNDARVNASERLAEVCRAVGAVPAHPDWLDSSCSLRYGVTRAEVRGLATTAIRAMTRLAKASVKERSNYIRLVLDDGGCRSSCSDFFLESTSLLHTLSGSIESVEYDGALEAIASFCSIELETAKTLVSGLDTSLRTAASDSWCANASQQIIGEMHSLVQTQLILPSEIGTSEFRGTGDWEIAQAISILSGVCDHNNEKDSRLLMSSRWTSMAMSTLEWMVPACALVRFSLQTEGKVHPLKSLTYSVEDYLLQAENTVEGVNTSTRLIGNQCDSIFEAVGLLSCPITSKERASQALASHLIGTVREFRNLSRAGKMLPAMRILSKVLHGRVQSQGDEPLLTTLVSGVLTCLKGTDGNAPEWPLTRLLAACSHRANLEINTLAFGKLKMADIVVTEAKSWHRDGSRFDFDLTNFVFESISALSGLLRQPSLLTRGGMRYAGAVLASLSIAERRSGMDLKLNSFIVRSISETPGSFFQAVLSSGDKNLQEDHLLLHDLSSICAAPFFAANTQYLGPFANALSDVLLAIVEGYKNGGVPQGILNLWFLCGTYSSKLDEIGGKLLASKITGPGGVSAAHSFATFISSLASALTKTAATTETSPSEDSTETKLCSFVIKEGFQEQHWYNCRTCGLTGEKGCCSNCARLCHNGHDVVYARFSSFFCDCGHDSTKSRSETSQDCKCLIPVSKGALILPEKKPDTLFEGPRNVSETVACARSAASLFRERSQKSLKRVRTAASKNGWAVEVSEAVTEAVDRWRSSRLNSDDCCPVFPATIEAPVPQCAELDNFFTLHVSKQGTIEVMSTTEESRRSRCLMAADSRGRVVLCEGSRMRFFSIASMANKSFASDPLDFSHSDIPFLKATVHDMNDVNGLRISTYNECHLMAWSKNEACVFVLQPSWEGVLKRVELPLPSSLDASETITKCEWLPEIDGFACVGMKDCCRVFRLSETGPSAVVEVKMSAPLGRRKIKDFAIVPRYKGYTVLGWKMFILVDQGELYETELNKDNLHGDAVTEVTVVESGRIAIPHLREGDAGERLDYLEQGGLLICQSSKSAAVAFSLENGKVTKTLHVLAPNLTKSRDPSTEISGPYTHWRCVEKVSIGDNGPAWSLFCVGRTRGSLESVLLELDMRQSPSLKASSPLTGICEGFVAFSLPIVESDMKPFDLSASKSLSERIGFSILTSSGILASFIEMGPDEDILSNPREQQPVLVFEKLLKARSELLSFQVDGVG